MFLFKIMVAKVFRRNHATLRCMGGLLDGEDSARFYGIEDALG